MKLTAKFPIWEITCAFSKLLKMLASGSVSTTHPAKSGLVVQVDLIISLENSHQWSVSVIWIFRQVGFVVLDSWENF